MGMSDLTREALAERVLVKEDHRCGSCSDNLKAGVRMNLLVVVRGHVNPHGPTIYVPSINQQGTYEHHPYFFHWKCWEEVVEALNEMNDGTDPDHVIGATVLGECVGCGAHILPGELMGAVYDGKLTLADRAPSGQWALDFIASSSVVHVCSVCLNDINLSIVEGLWGSERYLRQGDECVDGVSSRCWRYGTCDRSAGRCHMSKEE